MTYPDDGGYRGAPRKFRGRCGAVWPGKGGWRATRRYRGRPAHIGNNRRERERGKAKSRKLALLCFASPHLSHHLALLSRTPNHHCWLWLLHHSCLYFFCFFPSVALRFEHPASDRALHTGIPCSLPLRSAPFQLNLVPKTL